MKKIFFVFLVYCLLPTVYCISQGTWTQKADFGGINRISAVGFSIGTKGYIGTGADSTYALRNDFWEYDPLSDTWTQKADFIGSPITNATGFSIGTKGYIVSGNNFYEWEQATNVWTQKSNFPGTSRGSAISFSIGTKGYYGIGLKSLSPPPPVFFSDFWEWNQATDTWTQKLNFGGGKRWSAVGFSIGTKGYIGTGYDGSYYNDFWEWNQTTNTWTQKANFGGTAIAWAVGFSINTKGYIGSGYGSPTGYLNDFWEWDQGANTWSQKPNWGGPSARNSAVGFSIGTKGYFGTGGSSTTSYYKDFWEFDPNGVGVNEIENNISISVFPNPFSKSAVLRITNLHELRIENLQLKVYDIDGKEVYPSVIRNSDSFVLRRSNLKSGVYFYQLVSQTKTIATGKLIIQ